jgi:hypothetical protein
LGAQSCLRLSLRTSISKKLHLGPQNGPGSENLLKIVNCQNGQKSVLSHLEKVGGPRYPPGSPEVRVIDDQVFLNIRRSCLHMVAYQTLILPYIGTLGWIIDHTDTMKCVVNDENGGCFGVFSQ